MNLSPNRYHRAAMTLHWLLAVLLGFQFMLGLRLDDISDLHQKFDAYQLHKSVGITILLFSLARIGLRAFLPRPLPADRGIKGLAARITHGLFYVVMIGGPLTGWAVVSTAKVKVPTVLFGVIAWPHLPLPAATNDTAQLAHVVLVWLLPELVALHLAGVAWHWRRKDDVPGRMIPPSLATTGALLAGLASVALCGLAGSLLAPPDWWRGILSGAPAPTAPAGSAAKEPAVPTIQESAARANEPAASSSEAARPPSADWHVVAGSRLGFTTSYAGTAITGSFRSWSATIHFDPAQLDQASIRATVSLSSAQSGDAERDSSLKGPGFFDVAVHPTATFVARRFERLGRDRYAAAGTLSLNGINRPVRLVFTLHVNDDSATAQGSATLSRLAFKVGQDEFESTEQIPDAVGVQFTIRAARE